LVAWEGLTPGQAAAHSGITQVRKKVGLPRAVGCAHSSSRVTAPTPGGTRSLSRVDTGEDHMTVGSKKMLTETDHGTSCPPPEFQTSSPQRRCWTTRSNDTGSHPHARCAATRSRRRRAQRGGLVAVLPQGVIAVPSLGSVDWTQVERADAAPFSAKKKATRGNWSQGGGPDSGIGMSHRPTSAMGHLRRDILDRNTGESVC